MSKRSGTFIGSESPEGIEAVVAWLNTNRGIDFSQYDPGMVFRCIEARAKRVANGNLDAYQSRLQGGPTEADFLVQALLVEATSNFREPESMAIDGQPINSVAISQSALQSALRQIQTHNESLEREVEQCRRKITELTQRTHDMENLLRSTDVHTLFLDEKLCIRRYTPRIGELFHLSHADIGCQINGFLATIRDADLEQKFTDVLNTGVPQSLEVDTTSGDYFLMRILPYRSDSDRAGVVMTLVDLTELKQAQSRFRNAIETSPSGMLLIDAQGFITLMNRECESIFGYERDELLGKPLETLVPEKYCPEHLLHRSQFFDAPRVRAMSRGLDVWGIRKDGTEIPLDVRLSPIEGPGGVTVLASIIDMTRSKQLESSLRLQVEQRDRFLATLSHELRNPMAAIVSAATLLSRTTAQPGSIDPCDIILRQAAQMTTLLDDLLDVSRVTQGKISLRIESIDLRDICRESLETVEPLVSAHRHRVTLSLPDEPVFAAVDRGRMLQVVENLLTNSIKYTPDAGRIELELTRQEDRALIRLQDNGRGIAAELLDSIFDMFVQSDSTLEHSDGGMGVGLTLVRGLVDLHGGRVHAISQGIDQGSVFTVELPITDPVPTEMEHYEPKRSPQATRVVLVEDNRDARMMLESILSMDGYLVQSAGNGVQGLAMILDFKPQLAVIDIGLPGMDGYEIARRVRQSGNDRIQLIALTGYGREEDRNAVFSAGFNHHLVKPVRIEQLEAILASVPNDAS